MRKSDHVNPCFGFRLTGEKQTKQDLPLFPSYLLSFYECTNEQMSPWDFFTFKLKLFYLEMTSEDLENMFLLSLYLYVSLEKGVVMALHLQALYHLCV